MFERLGARGGFGGSGSIGAGPIAGAPTIWISPTGNDGNGGTEASPLLNLNTAINWASSGDIIMVKGGTYTPSALLDVYKSNLTIMAAPGAVPIFDAINYATPGAYNDRVIRLQDVSNVTIIGLGFTRGPDGGMQIKGTCSDVEIVRCWFFANGRRSLSEGEGIAIEGTITGLLVADCDSYENFDALGTPAGSNADGFRVSIYSGSATFRGCRAWRNSDDGFDAFNNSFDAAVTTVPVTFESCWAWENGYLANGTASNGDGNGFKLGGQRPALGNGSGGNTMTDCLSWGNREIGITDNSCTLPNTIQDTTVYDSDRINIEGGSPAHVIRRCIAFQAVESNLSIANVTNVSGNSWQRATVTSADFRSVTDTTARGARGAGGVLPATDFLAVLPTSPVAGMGATP